MRAHVLARTHRLLRLRPEEAVRVLVVGDLHADATYFKYVVNAAYRYGCAHIIQCGDLGFWPHTDPDYVPFLDKKLAKRDLTMVWVDGNHENFDALEAREWETTEEGFWKTGERVFYAPRGHRWEWEGVKFLALGGGHSIDKAYRLEYRSWWRQELITMKDVSKALDGGGVDVMICHDMPCETPEGPKLYFKSNGEDIENRRMVKYVMDRVNPKVLFHGHYHYRYTSRVPGTRIEGLDMNGTYQDNWYVLDLVTLRQAGQLKSVPK